MVLLCAIWGLQQVAIKLTLPGISPFLQVALRSLAAAFLVLLWARWRGLSIFVRDGSLRPGVMAGALFGLEFLCIYAGLEMTGASRMVVFLYTSPCFTVLGLHLFIPGERIGWRQLSGVVLAFGGIVLAFADGLSNSTAGYRHWLGDLLGIAAAIMWAATTVIVRGSALARVSAAKALFYQLSVSAAIALPASLLLGEPGLTAPGPVVWLAFAYQVLIVAFASYLIWFWMLTRFLANRLMVFSFLTPLFGVTFGVLLLGEQLSALFGLAALLVVIGIALVNAPARKP